MLLKIIIDRERVSTSSATLTELDLAEKIILYVEAVAVAVHAAAIVFVLRDLPLLIDTQKRKAKRASLTTSSWQTYLHCLWEEDTEESLRKEEIDFELKASVAAVEGLPP